MNEPTSTGISVLVEPQNAVLEFVLTLASSDRMLTIDAVVFVHGFTGHPVRTWTHKAAAVAENPRDVNSGNNERPAKKPRLASVIPALKKSTDREKVYWPLHLLPGILPTARVLVYGYDTKIRHALEVRASQNTVYDFASDFLSSLEAFRRSQPARPLLFVAHSLGGIIVKETLRQSHGYKHGGPFD